MSSVNETSPVSRTLAEFVCNTTSSDLPEVVAHEAKRALMNYMASSLGGCGDPDLQTMFGPVCSSAGSGKATVVGKRGQFDVCSASFLNSVISSLLDFDDTHLPTVIHPSGPVFAALLAVSQSRSIPGRKLLAAFALGVDASCRIGRAAAAGNHYQRGQHITATCGIFGAAAGVGKLLDLSVDEMVASFGHAAGQSAGLVENLGTLSKFISLGNAARNGLMSCVFAKQGVLGPEFPLEGKFGFLASAGDGADPTLIAADLGLRWELLENEYKTYPTGVVLNPVIDACLEVNAQHGIGIDSIDSVHVFANPLFFLRTDRPQIGSGREARLSFQHCVSAALKMGRLGLQEVSDASVVEPQIEDFRQRVTGTARDDIPVGAAEVSFQLRGGNAISVRIINARGSVQCPLSDADIEQKLIDLASTGAAWCKIDQVIKSVWLIDEFSDAGEFMALLIPGRD